MIRFVSKAIHKRRCTYDYSEHSIGILTMAVAIGTAGMIAISGCQGESSSSHKTTAQVEVHSGPLQAGTQIKEANPEQGKEIYSSKCAACHGAKAEGRIGIGPSLASKTFLEAASDEMLAATIKKGRSGTTMIPWGTVLGETDVRSIIAYIRSTTPHEPAQLDESPLKGSAESGKEIFSGICARCHGSSGAGYQESSSGTGIGRTAFLNSVSNGYLRYIIKHGKSLTQMRPFDSSAPTAVANLGDAEIDNVIAYLRSSAW